MTARKYQSYQEDYTYPELEQEQYPFIKIIFLKQNESKPERITIFREYCYICILTALFSFLFLSIK